MSGADYSLIEWIVEPTIARSHWDERGQYATLTEARRAAKPAQLDGRLLAITQERGVLVIYHDGREWDVSDEPPMV